MKKIFLVIFLFTISSCSFDWSYLGKRGPENWGSLKGGRIYRFCAIGYNQSPINISEKFLDDDLEFYYSDLGVEKKKERFFLEIDFFDRGYLKRRGRKFFARNIIFHHPSEHQINGEKSSLEMQIYHKSDDEQWLAIALFLEIAEEENNNFDDLIKFISSKEKESKINLEKIVNSSFNFFFYDGSFTTPPCHEGVKWYVAKEKIKISKKQMNLIIKNAIFTTPNIRPIQEFHPEKF